MSCERQIERESRYGARSAQNPNPSCFFSDPTIGSSHGGGLLEGEQLSVKLQALRVGGGAGRPGWSLLVGSGGAEGSEEGEPGGQGGSAAGALSYREPTLTGEAGGSPVPPPWPRAPRRGDLGAAWPLEAAGGTHGRQWLSGTGTDAVLFLPTGQQAQRGGVTSCGLTTGHEQSMSVLARVQPQTLS